MINCSILPNYLLLKQTKSFLHKQLCEKWSKYCLIPDSTFVCVEATVVCVGRLYRVMQSFQRIVWRVIGQEVKEIVFWFRNPSLCCRWMVLHTSLTWSKQKKQARPWCGIYTKSLQGVKIGFFHRTFDAILHNRHIFVGTLALKMSGFFIGCGFPCIGLCL